MWNLTCMFRVSTLSRVLETCKLCTMSRGYHSPVWRVPSRFPSCCEAHSNIRTRSCQRNKKVFMERDGSIQDDFLIRMLIGHCP